MLSAVDLASMRAAVMASLPETARILRVIRQSDGLGGFLEVWTELATAPCRVAPRENTPVETAVGGRIVDRVLWVITLPAGLDVRPDDRIAVGSRTFEILGVLSPRSVPIPFPGFS